MASLHFLCTLASLHRPVSNLCDRVHRVLRCTLHTTSTYILCCVCVCIAGSVRVNAIRDMCSQFVQPKFTRFFVSRVRAAHRLFRRCPHIFLFWRVCDDADDTMITFILHEPSHRWNDPIVLYTRNAESVQLAFRRFHRNDFCSH